MTTPPTPQEVNVRIATEVMGWTHLGYDVWETEEGPHHVCPNYLTSISDALKAAEKLARDEGLLLDIRRCPISKPEHMWLARFLDQDKQEDVSVMGWGTGSNIRQAIVNAILAYLDARKGEK